MHMIGHDNCGVNISLLFVVVNTTSQNKRSDAAWQDPTVPRAEGDEVRLVIAL